MPEAPEAWLTLRQHRYRGAAVSCHVLSSGAHLHQERACLRVLRESCLSTALSCLCLQSQTHLEKQQEVVGASAWPHSAEELPAQH